MSLRLDLALLEPSGISTEKALVLLMIGGGVAMQTSLTLTSHFTHKSECARGQKPNLWYLKKAYGSVFDEAVGKGHGHSGVQGNTICLRWMVRVGVQQGGATQACALHVLAPQHGLQLDLHAGVDEQAQQAAVGQRHAL